MKPYYDHAGITIYHGDCREILPTLQRGSADLIVTDPPYGVPFALPKRGLVRMVGGDDRLSLKDWLPPILGVLRMSRHVYIFGFYKREVSADCGLGQLAELIWDKGGASGLSRTNPLWIAAHEMILFGVRRAVEGSNVVDKGGVKAARIRKGSVLRFQKLVGTQTQRHPTEKPVSLLRVLIESSSTFGETVLDPFMGVGSTLVAARREERKAIGIEIEEEYCEIAAKRLGTGFFGQ